MHDEVLLKGIAPCGLVCFTCAAAKGGITQYHSQELLRFLDSFDMYAERLSEYEPRLNKYPEFKEVLGLLGEAGCEGCRGGGCKYPGCEISPCAVEHGVDFCFECSSYPCDKADFDPLLKAKWLAANDRMKAIGVAAYFEEARKRSHYA